MLIVIIIINILWPAGDRTNVAGSDLSDILPEEIEADVKLAAEISMGTEVSEQDINNIMHLCDQVRSLHSSHLQNPIAAGRQCWWSRLLSLVPEFNHVGLQSLPHLNCCQPQMEADAPFSPTRRPP